MLAMAPSWLSSLVMDSGRRWGPDPVLTLRFEDELSAPLRVHVRTSDTLPVGAELINHTGHGPADVQVYLGGWDTIAGVRLFREAVFVHGENRFKYSYVDIRVNNPADTAFGPSCHVP
jgi:hypothetical protein